MRQHCPSGLQAHDVPEKAVLIESPVKRATPVGACQAGAQKRPKLAPGKMLPG